MVIVRRMRNSAGKSVNDELYSAFIKASYRYSGLSRSHLRPLDRFKLVQNFVYNKTGKSYTFRHLPILRNISTRPRSPPTVKVTSLSVSPSSAPPKLSLVITDRGDAQYDQKSSPTEDGQSSMSRRRLAMNIPTLSDQLHLPSAASVNTQTSFNSFQSHFSALSPMLATPVDQILHTPIGPPEILRSPRRQPRLGNCLALRRIGCGMDSPSSPYMSPFAGLSFPSPTEMSPIAQGDMCPLHQSTPRGPFQLPPENIPIRKPINSLPPLPRRLSYFQSSAVVKPALSISDDHRRRLVIDTRSDFTREPLASPLIIGHLPTLPSPF